MTGEDNHVTVAVCRTQQISNKYFRSGTHFLPAVVLDAVVNSAPRIRPVPLLHIENNDVSHTAETRLKAVDPEGDPVFWELRLPLPSRGMARVDTTSGDFHYKTYAGQAGSDSVWVTARDRPKHAGIPSNSSSIEIKIELKTKKNRPFLMATSNGKQLDFVRGISHLHAAMTVDDSDQKPDDLILLAVDLDVREEVNFRVNNDEFQLLELKSKEVLNRSLHACKSINRLPPMAPTE